MHVYATSTLTTIRSQSTSSGRTCKDQFQQKIPPMRQVLPGYFFTFLLLKPQNFLKSPNCQDFLSWESLPSFYQPLYSLHSTHSQYRSKAPRHAAQMPSPLSSCRASSATAAAVARASPWRCVSRASATAAAASDAKAILGRAEGWGTLAKPLWTYVEKIK